MIIEEREKNSFLSSNAHMPHTNTHTYVHTQMHTHALVSVKLSETHLQQNHDTPHQMKDFSAPYENKI